MEQQGLFISLLRTQWWSSGRVSSPEEIVRAFRKAADGGEWSSTVGRRRVDRSQDLSIGVCSSRGDDSRSGKLVVGSYGGGPHAPVEGGACLA